MKLARTAARSTFTLLSAALVAGCAGSQPEIYLEQPVGQTFSAEAPLPPTPPAAPPAAPADANQASSTAAPAASTAAPAAPGEEMLTDENIASILSVANGGEIEQAKVAQKNAKDPRIKAFAAHMIDEHGKAMVDTAQLLKEIHVSPAESPLSSKLSADSRELVTKLGNEQGTDFDRDYIAAQIQEHQAVLDLMDSKLLVQVKNPELKAAILAFRPTVAHHLNEAKSIQASRVAK